MSASPAPDGPTARPASHDEAYSALRHGSSEDAWDLLARAVLVVSSLVFLAAVMAYAVWLFVEAATN
ncbi:hypothetical protein [Motilibacter aurantiacus]|uniref:hypothetical protein n=1 Tax=Motilibacter aurantiacus TaxID=2714955 RepID=UPI0014094AE0|nr:hypothetical protein [Motilibacter aurantiacus]NHC46091.1 hypothetical protein [Motilibacter aurantiacus]